MINRGVLVRKIQSGDLDRKNVGDRAQNHEKETGLEIVGVLALEIGRKEGRGPEGGRGRDHEKDTDMGREDRDHVSTTIEGVGEALGETEEAGEEVAGNEGEENTTILASGRESNTRGTWRNR